MRALSILLTILALAGMVNAQVFVSNNVARAEAIKVASQLKVGMSEEDARKFLAKHGVTNAIGLGALSGWSCFYNLTDGSSLVLEYRPRAMTTNHWWEGKGILEKAFIQSNRVNIVSITLTNVR